MRRRLALGVCAAVLLPYDPDVLGAEVGRAKPYRIGLIGFPRGSDGPQDIFKKALAELGYVDGKDVVFDFRFTDGVPQRFPGLAMALVANSDVIVAVTTNAAVAAAQATSTVPIVFTYVSSPADVGHVASLTHPGGNVTGITDFGDDVAVKLIEIAGSLRQKASRIAVLISDNPAHPNQVKLMQGVALKVGVALIPTLARAPDDLEAAFAAISVQRSDAVIVLGGVPHAAQRERIAELAIKIGIPTIFLARQYVEAGGLLSYGAQANDLYSRPAALVDKILRGSNPGDLPIEQPTRFELAINLRTAAALNLTIPKSLLISANELIR